MLRSAQARQLRRLRWGQLPAWARDAAVGSKLINARAETVGEKPSFRTVFRQRRCLVLADGFCKWQCQVGQKQPFYCRLSPGKLFAFAGLGAHWQGSQPIDSCTLLTTEANNVVRPIHAHTPVILDRKDYNLRLPEVHRLRSCNLSCAPIQWQ